MTDQNHVIERLDRFEEKIDQKLDTLIRVEERQLEASKAMERAWTKFREQDLRLNTLEEDTIIIKAQLASRNSFIEKVLYPILVAGVCGIGGFFLGTL